MISRQPSAHLLTKRYSLTRRDIAPKHAELQPHRCLAAGWAIIFAYMHLFEGWLMCSNLSFPLITHSTYTLLQ